MSDSVYDVLVLLFEMAQARGCTVSQLSLAWVVAQPSVTSAIIGPRTLEHLEDNLGALEVALSQEDLTRIDKISPGS